MASCTRSWSLVRELDLLCEVLRLPLVRGLAFAPLVRGLAFVPLVRGLVFAFGS